MKKNKYVLFYIVLGLLLVGGVIGLLSQCQYREESVRRALGTATQGVYADADFVQTVAAAGFQPAGWKQVNINNTPYWEENPVCRGGVNTSPYPSMYIGAVPCNWGVYVNANGNQIKGNWVDPDVIGVPSPYRFVIATSGGLPATSTHTYTSTRTPTATPTLTYTFTPTLIPPTKTASYTPTFTSVSTRTATRTPTQTPSPTPTKSFTPTTETSQPVCVYVTWNRGLNMRTRPSMYDPAYRGDDGLAVNISKGSTLKVERVFSNWEGTWAEFNQWTYFALYLKSNDQTYGNVVECQ